MRRDVTSGPEEQEADVSQNKIGDYLSSAVEAGAC